MYVTALSGGVGGAKLCLGLSKILGEKELTIIGNTGDDIDLYGLHISPDLDIVMYTLADIVDPEKGWGIENDTFSCLDSLSTMYGEEKWFRLGDRDLATHIKRTELLQKGYQLSEVTQILCSSLGLNGISLIPMSNQLVQTHVRIQDDSVIHFEEYFVKRRCQDDVKEVIYKGSKSAIPAPDIIDSLDKSDLIVICPSNPIASIGPMLSIQAIRQNLEQSTCPVVTVSPLIKGKPLKGPADKFMKGVGFQSDSIGVAEYYKNLVSHFVLDIMDREMAEDIQALDMDVVVTKTVMNTLADKIELAKTILNIVK